LKAEFDLTAVEHNAAVTALRELDQRRHSVISAQNRVDQLERGVRPRGQALIQPARNSRSP